MPQRGSNVRAFIPDIASMSSNMMARDGRDLLRPSPTLANLFFCLGQSYSGQSFLGQADLGQAYFVWASEDKIGGVWGFRGFRGFRGFMGFGFRVQGLGSKERMERERR